MTNQKKPNKFEIFCKYSVIVICIAVWLVSWVANLHTGYEIPSSVQGIMTMVVGYLLSGAVMKQFKR